MLNGIDYVVVFGYLIGILVLGMYLGKFVSSSQDFFLGGKMHSFWVIGMSIVATDIGAQDFVAVSGQAYRYGISAANFDWIGSVPAMLLAGFVFIPYFWKGGMYTIPEYLGKRYNEGVRLIASLTWIVFFAFDLGIMLWASALVFESIMGWNIWFSIVSTALVTGIYTFLGGLTAVMMTDVVQFVIMYVGGIAVVFLGLYHVGGFVGLYDKVHAMGADYQSHFDLILPADTNTPFPWTGILFGLTLVMSNAYMIGNQAIVQRCLSAKNEWHAKMGMITGAFWKMFIPVLVLLPGLIANVTHPNLAEGDQAFPELIRAVLPPGLLGLMFAAFLAGLMSSISSLVNSTATLWTKDIYEKYINKNATDKHYLRVGQVTTALLFIFAVITAPVSTMFEGIYIAVQTFLSFFQGPTFAILLLGIFWTRTTQWGGLFGLTGGMLISLYLHIFQSDYFTIQDPFLYISWWSFVAAFFIAVAVSLFTQPHPRERLYGLIYQLVDNRHSA
ncbi:MAG: sodium/solute symporter [Candidatus Omnitrophota bacterium]